MAEKRLGRLRDRSASSSSSQSLGSTGVDIGKDWRASAVLSDGTKVEAEYNINEPSSAPAHFHVLLDTSGSMYHVEDSEYGSADKKKHVYQLLFECFDELVRSGEALRPDDMIYIWSFNARTTLLCEVKTKNYFLKKDNIRERYESELQCQPWNGETRLYDAVAHVMDTKLSKTWKANQQADFFLVAFTDGQDTGTGSKTLDAMIQRLNELVGRLHTFFITSNLPMHSELHSRLNSQQEMRLIHCRNTQLWEISKAFNTVRDLIKAVLVVVTLKPGAMSVPQLARIVEFGKTKESIGDKLMATLATSHYSLIEAYGKLQLHSG